MMTSKFKKYTSILTLSLILSGSLLNGVSAKNNNAIKPNNTLDKNVTSRIGGGPSPSGSLQKRRSYYKNFTHSQLSKLNRMYNNTVTSSSYARRKYMYDISCFVGSAILGSVSKIAGFGSSTMFMFCNSYFSLIQKTANTVNQAYYKGGTRALYVTEYYRPANGEKVICLSWY
ncbi:hypothetical protein NRP93_003743 [Clostridium botulinum]|nr:hypothetical protein [Clostridium botulinum]